MISKGCAHLFLLDGPTPSFAAYAVDFHFQVIYKLTPWKAQTLVSQGNTTDA